MKSKGKCDTEEESIESDDQMIVTKKRRAKQIQKESILLKYFHPVEIYMYNNYHYFKEDLNSIFTNFNSDSIDQA